jgi:predicted phosphodiesterase
MRVFALSDIHVDFEANARWVENLSKADYRDDVLILAGDVTDVLSLFEWCIGQLASRFRKVLFVPGNHDLWVVRERKTRHCLDKLEDLSRVVDAAGASMRPYRERGVQIVPVFGWYDYSFGEPDEELKSIWMDFHACRWPDRLQLREVAAYFDSLNDEHRVHPTADTTITFSHFLPRIDLMPRMIPLSKRVLYPVLGTTRLERRLRQLGSNLHVYGHSHVNRSKRIDGVSYVNNAFGYPSEDWMTSRRLVCIHEC